MPFPLPNLLVLAASAGGAAHPEVPLALTLLFAALLAGLILCLALEEKLHAKKSFIAGGFAVLCLFVANGYHLLPIGALTNVFHEKVHLPVYIPGVDWGVITIIFGSSLFVNVTAKSGLFTWSAIKLTKASRGDPRKLLWCYGLMTVVFSALLNNVTAMIIVGSLTGVSLKRLGKTEHLLGFLLIEGLLTNIGGLLTLISSVPNIIVGAAAGITFVDFFVKALPYVLVATAGTILLGTRLFRIRGLASEAERAAAVRRVEGFDENDGIESAGFFWFGAVMLVLFIVTIAAASVLPNIRDLGMGFVALGFALIMLLRHKHEVERFYQAMDWDLLGFFVALFVVINVMEHARVLALIGQGLGALVGLGPTAGTGSLLVSAAGFSSVTDNIPLSAMLAKIIGAFSPKPGPANPLWWAVIFGANLGGNLTPIGSASTLVAVTLMHKHNVRLSFGGFVRKALPYALLQILLAALYVLLILPKLPNLSGGG